MSHRLGLSSISVTLAVQPGKGHKDEGEIIISMDVANLMNESDEETKERPELKAINTVPVIDSNRTELS